WRVRAAALSLVFNTSLRKARLATLCQAKPILQPGPARNRKVRRKETEQNSKSQNAGENCGAVAALLMSSVAAGRRRWEHRLRDVNRDLENRIAEPPVELS